MKRLPFSIKNFTRQALLHPRVHASFGFIVCAIGLFFLFLTMDAADTYSYLIIGRPGFVGLAKTPDIVLATAMSGAFMALTCLIKIFRPTVRHGAPAWRNSQNSTFWISAILLIYGLSALIFGTTEPIVPLLIGVGGLFLALLDRTTLNRDRTCNVLTASPLAATLPIVIAVLSFHSIGWTFAPGIVVAASGLCAIFGAGFAWARPIHRRGLLVLQAPLVFLYLALIPVFADSGIPAQNSTTPALIALVTGLILLGLFDVLRRNYWTGLPVISPAACAALLAAIDPPQTFFFMSADDYHFGEYLVAWNTLVEFGYLPYIEFIPPHGLVNYVPGLFSSLFYDGEGTSFYAGAELAIVLLRILLFLSLTALVPLPVAFVCVLIFPVHLIGVAPVLLWTSLGIALAVLANPALLAKPNAWLACWLAGGTTLVLLLPGQGAALVLATIPAGLLVALGLLRRSPHEFGLLIAGIGMAALILSIATPLDAIVIGALSYVVQNAGINLVAYGIEWTASYDDSLTGSPAVQSLRMIWTMLPALGLWALLRLPECRTSQERQSLVLLAGVCLFFPFLILSYIFGRIDPGALSRVGTFTLWAFAVPAMLTLARASRAKSAAIALVPAALLLSFYGGNPIRTLAASWHPIHGSAETPVQEPRHADEIVRLRKMLDARLDSNDSYIDLTGRTALYSHVDRRPPKLAAAPYNLAHPEQQAALIGGLREAVPEVALFRPAVLPTQHFEGLSPALRTPLLFRWSIETYRPVETETGHVIGVPRVGIPGDRDASGKHYLSSRPGNLTDTNWAHGVARQGPAIFVPDPENLRGISPGDTITFENGERRTVNRIIGAELRLDGALLDPEKHGYPKRFSWPVSAHDQELGLFEQVFRIRHLGVLPTSWGRSWNTLRQDFKLAADIAAPAQAHHLVSSAGGYTPDGPDPFLVFALPEGFMGRDGGVLVFNVVCKGTSRRAAMQVFWGDPDFSERTSVTFDVMPGRVIVPLYAQPSWVLGSPTQLRIDLAEPDMCTLFSVEDPALYTLYTGVGTMN